MNVIQIHRDGKVVTFKHKGLPIKTATIVTVQDAIIAEKILRRDLRAMSGCKQDPTDRTKFNVDNYVAQKQELLNLFARRTKNKL